MLILSRKSGESISIGPDITVEVSRLKGDSVKVAIDAPREVRVLRSELESHEEPEWIEWSGGESPVSPDTSVQIWVRAIGEKKPISNRTLPAKFFYWKHTGEGSDITKYRVLN